MSLAIGKIVRSRWHLPVWAIAIACLGAVLAYGQKSSTTSDAAVRTPPTSSGVATDREPQAQPAFEELEAEAIEFVKEHHPELVSLLQLLKAMRQKEYETAIRDIVRARKRIESFVKREPERHTIELDAWKLQSKIDLLLAKGFARDKAFDTKVLQGLLKQQVENQKKQLKYEQSTLNKRQEQVAELLGRIEGHEKEKIEQQMAILMKRVDAKAGKPKPDAKPTKEKP